MFSEVIYIPASFVVLYNVFNALCRPSDSDKSDWSSENKGVLTN